MATGVLGASEKYMFPVATEPVASFHIWNTEVFPVVSIYTVFGSAVGVIVQEAEKLPSVVVNVATTLPISEVFITTTPD
jgi:energy-converting hydrogenase Eha subunit G